MKDYLFDFNDLEYIGTSLWFSATFLLQYSSVGIKRIVELNGISPWIYNRRTVEQRNYVNCY